MATRKTRSATSRVGGFLRGIGKAIPVGIPPLLRRFWDFTQKNSKEFSKHLKDPQEKEEKLLKEVIKKFRG
ncbi:MAG: hypothetical protein HQ564_08425 [Candidatus Saganbacteria bacterium]|nr:hypothetical protein [Candidatus Saganbacteria bacterium]